MKWSPVMVIVAVACAGTAAQRSPMMSVPGTERAVVEQDLKAANYCRVAGPPKASETYEVCRGKGIEFGETWAVVDYDGSGQLARLRRFEHIPDAARARQRYAELAERRAQELGTPSQQARALMAKLDETPEGAVSWQVWTAEDGQLLVALYLATPDDPRAPHIIEIVRWSLQTDK